MTTLKAALAETAIAVNAELDRLLPLTEGPENRLIEAMRYSTLDGGKRLRPFFVLQTSRLFNVAEQAAQRVAAVIESCGL